MKIYICTKCGIEFWLGDSQDGKCPSCFQQEVRKSEETERATKYRYDCGICGGIYWIPERAAACPQCTDSASEEHELTEYKYECGDCGCYYWVLDRDEFECPNCKDKESY